MSTADAGFLIWDIAAIKVDRLISEIKALNASVAPVDAPKKAVGASVTAAVEDTDVDSDGNDPDYMPPKRAREEPESPTHIYDSDDNEIVEDTEKGTSLKERQSAKKAKKDMKKKENSTSQKKKKATQKKTLKGTVEEPVEIDSGDKSDGQSALKQVVEVAQKLAGNARRGPANVTMQNFTEPVPVSDVKGELHWEFCCKRCSCEPLMPKINNLATHYAKCLKKNPDPLPEDSKLLLEHSNNFNLTRTREFLSQYLEKGRLNLAIEPLRKGFLQLFTAWILDESLPWTTGKSPTLRLLFQYLKIPYMLPSDTTVKACMAEIYNKLHGKLVHELTSQTLKISYSTDTWTVKQMTYSFACSGASFINNNWDLICHIIDFKPLEDKEHGGVLGRLAFVNGAQKRGGLDKMSTVSVSWSVITPAYLFVTTLLDSGFLAGMDEAGDPDEEDNYECTKAHPFFYDANDDTNKLDLDLEEVESTSVGISKDNETAMADALAQSSTLKQAIDAWTFETKSLHGLGLSKLDCKLLEQLKNCLEPFTQAMLQLLHESQATPLFALPLYLKLENHLHSTIGDRVNNHIKVRHGVQAGLAKLLQYQAYADKNQYYKVATALHPSLHSKWFRKLGHSETEQNHLVLQVEDLVKLIEKTYAPKYGILQSASNLSAAMHSKSTVPATTSAFLTDVCTINVPTVSPTVANMTTIEILKDEIKRYFKNFEGGLGELNHPLAWWKIHTPAFPIISQMARDFLAILATSISVEHAFSKSCHVCQDLRSSMKADMISEALLTKVWISSGLFDVNAPVTKK
ncbi:hypothetical protein D9619_005142 [Psilocybe cf. subviscida]|uniref:HAT C-terminal dimerisation domain-containing protein n=1 Tax=Psilocybe cf. subviscida TaxID=2480587 RepID=A0A8H5BPL1_9AGAR|nr:hypothetical protein D9619_005142 [Psilocybe cf. subviscida]